MWCGRTTLRRCPNGRWGTTGAPVAPHRGSAGSADRGRVDRVRRHRHRALDPVAGLAVGGAVGRAGRQLDRVLAEDAAHATARGDRPAGARGGLLQLLVATWGL